MKRKICISLIIISVIVFITSFVKATGIEAISAYAREMNFESIDQAEQYIKENIDNIDITDAIKMYQDLSKNYSNDQIADAIEDNKQILEEKGIDESLIDSGTTFLRAVDGEKLNEILTENIDINDIEEQIQEGSTPAEILDNVQQKMSVNDKISLGVDLFFAFWIVKVAIVIFIILAIYNIIIRWRIFSKARKHAWASLIPIYRDVVMYKVCGITPWVLLLLLVPVIGWFILAIINIYSKFTLAEGFGKGIGFGFGLWLLGPIFEGILAFSKKTRYLGFN